MNDTTNDPALLVSSVLQGSRDHLDTEQIAKRVPLSSQQIAAALKQLARQGQIEVLPAGTKRPARYGWLATTPRAIAPATPPTELTEQAQAERAEFKAEYGSDGNCSCHISPPCGSCSHPGNPRNQAEDESAWTPRQALSLPASAVVANKSSPLSLQDRYAALRDDIASSLRASGLPSLANVTADSDLATAVAHLAITQLERQAEAPAMPAAQAYLIRATKRRLRVMRSAGAAQTAALASARAGARRAEVYALVPVGHARRGADWVEP